MRAMADDDIERLILELHSSGTGAGSTAAGEHLRLEQWLRLLASREGSDLLLVAGAPPSIRVDGRIHPLDEGPLDGEEIEGAVVPAAAASCPPRIPRDARCRRVIQNLRCWPVQNQPAP